VWPFRALQNTNAAAPEKKNAPSSNEQTLVLQITGYFHICLGLGLFCTLAKARTQGDDQKVTKRAMHD